MIVLKTFICPSIEFKKNKDTNSRNTYLGEMYLYLLLIL